MKQTHLLNTGKLGATVLVVAGTLILLGCSGDQAMTSPTAPSGGGQGAMAVQLGLWGGGGVRLEVGATEARIEFVCAHAVLGAPIFLDDLGSFAATGTYFPEGPGPIRAGDEQGRPASILGRVTGDMMKLSVTLDEGNEFIGSYELQRNKGGPVYKCQ